MFGILGMLFWLVITCLLDLYGLFMFGGISDRFRFQTAKEKNFGGKDRVESGQESGQKLGGLPWEKMNPSN